MTEVAKKSGERYPPKSVYGIICALKRYLVEKNGSEALNPLDARGYTPLYKLYRYVPPQFSLKTGIDFDHYGLKSDTAFKKPRGRMNVFVFSTTNK